MAYTAVINRAFFATKTHLYIMYISCVIVLDCMTTLLLYSIILTLAFLT